MFVTRVLSGSDAINESIITFCSFWCYWQAPMVSYTLTMKYTCKCLYKQQHTYLIGLIYCMQMRWEKRYYILQSKHGNHTN